LPVVTIELWEGRTVDQKRRLVRAVTDAMVEHAGARPDALHVIIHEVPKENWGLAGVLGPDRTDV
jgi:4-oxalocrotonate tautomerase